MLQALSKTHNSFLRPLKKKGFKEERVSTIELYDIVKSHDPGIQQEPLVNAGCTLHIVHLLPTSGGLRQRVSIGEVPAPDAGAVKRHHG